MSMQETKVGRVADECRVIFMFSCREHALYGWEQKNLQSRVTAS